MVEVNKLKFLIFSVISINLNILTVSTAQDADRAVDQYLSIIDKSYNNAEQSQDQYKRAKREEDNSQVDYVLTGFHENGTIPVNFPKDICLLELNGVLYASALHYSSHPHTLVNQTTLLTIFKNVEKGVFAEIFTCKTESAVDMDCAAMDDIGFVVISNTIEHDIVDLNEGSPVFRITSDTVQIVQYFSQPFQNKIYLRSYGNELYLMQLILSQPNTPNLCPIFKWNSNHFDLIAELPCTNSMNMEQFDIESDIYVVLANHKNELGETATFSYIYKFITVHRKFVLHQQIRTNAAVDVNYFNINDEHFLVFANSYEMLANGDKNYETQSVIYKHSNDYFTPFQTILLYGVQQFLPVMGSQNEFTLLVSCKEQATKSWQYNGWQFFESDVQFTGGALGQGVSNMRTYSMQGSVAVVVANTLMVKEASNIFFPQFVSKQKPRVVQETIGNWCSANRLEASLIDDAKNVAIELEKLPMRSIPDVQNVDEINFLEDVTIDTITTKQLRINDTILDQKFADKINEMVNIIENLNKRLAEMEMSSTQRNTMSDESKLETTFHYDDNILHSDAQVVGQDNEASSEKSELELVDLEELTIGKMIRMEFINGHPFADMVLVNRDLNLSQIVVSELILKDPQSYVDVIGKSKNNLNEEVMVKSASESFVAPTAGIVEKMKVNSLLVDGNINRLDLSLLNEFALKVRGDQVLESGINFESLQAASLQALTVSKRQINDIVRTVDGPFTVDQSIQFTSPVLVNELIVNQRINNIEVVDGAFNILLKRSDHEQVIQALKVFEEVKLLNPIVLQGKITKSNLNKINPIVSITRDIVLEGDYEISGNTTIIRLIRGENFYGSGGVYNAKDVLIDGLRLNTPVIEQIFEFVQPIKTTNLLSKSVNNVDVTKLVRTGEEIQHIYGEKNFTSELHVTNGVCEAFIINDVDLSVLNATVLKRTGAQTIDGKITFNSIRVERASAKTISLFGHKFSDYLTKTDQIIPGNLTIKGNLIVNNIQIENMRTNNRICNYDIGAMIADTVTTSTDTQSLITGEKVFRNHLTIGNVQIRGNVFQLGTMDSILGHLSILNEAVTLNGPITLTNNLRVGKLTFTQSINGISSSDFGYQWLLTETDQDFIQPQTVYTIRTDENVVLNGSFNNVDVVNHFGITQFKHEPVFFKNASFVRAIFQQPITLNGLISGIKFPQDVVLKDADFLQTIPGVAVNDITVSGKIIVEEQINNINVNIACDLLSPEPSPYALVLERDANFEHAPRIANLNEQNVNQLYNEVWLSHKNVELTGTPRFSHVQFDKPIEIKGLLNGFDVSYLGSHYVSLTKPQEIVAEVEINGNVLFQGDIRSGSIYLNGTIKDTNSGNAIKIEEFDKSVLKKYIDQEITGEWFIAEVNVAGGINSLVNGFDAVSHVARYSNPVNNVTSLKSFDSLAVTNVNCQYGCTLMNVDIGDWMSKVVFVGGNYTVQGTTVMTAPLFYNNLNVLGVVNNLTFTPENILLKSANQIINGNVYISNKSVIDNRILPLSFANVQLESINGKSLNDLYLNIVYKDDPLSAIGTRIEFNELLTVDYLQLSGDFNGINLNELIDQFQLYQAVTNYGEHVQHLSIIGNGIVDELKAKRNYMATYRLQQVIFGNIKKILSVEVTTHTETFDVFVILNVTDINGFLNFYIFDRDTSVLALANSLFGFQPKDMHILDIFSIRISDRDFLIVQTQNHFSGAFGHSFFTHFKGQFRNVYELHGNVSREIVGLNMGTDDCFVTYSRHATNVAVACAFFNEPGILGFQQVDELYSSSGVVEVRSITSNNRVEIIVLDLEGKISVWSLDQQHKFVRSQIIKTLHTATHISVAHQKGYHYIAACSETPVSSTHLGSIEIYISPANAYANVQSIVIESPIRIELSVVESTNDLVLYVLTDTIGKPLVIYRFTGITKFKEFTAGVTIPRAQRLNVLKAKSMGKELISLISEGLGGMIIEAKVK